MLGDGLSKEEIKHRLVRLRNLEYLHKKARKRIVRQDKEINLLRLRIKELEERDKEKDKIIDYLKLQLEEIKIKIFGKKKDRDKDKKDGSSKKPKDRQNTPRDPSSYQRPIPNDNEITKIEDHPIDNCPKCATTLTRKKIIVYYIEDIPLDKPQKEIIKHNVEQGYCPVCRKWRSAIPLPSAKCLIGQKLRQYICYLSIILRLSNQQIEDHVEDIHRINISQGEISKILEKEADRLRPEYEKLKTRVQQQQAIHYDETSWKVPTGTQGNYAWIMTGTETDEAVFSLGQSRGKGNINALNGNHNDIGITDDYGAYRNQFKHHQLCWAHPHRKWRDLAESGELKKEIKNICKKSFEQLSSVYYELEQTVKTKFDYQKTHNHFIDKISSFTKANLRDPLKLKKLKETFIKNKEQYLTCLKFPGIVPLDNNKAERGLRHLVIKRKISYGSKTQQGAEATSILASVLLSLKWMNPENFMMKYLNLGV